MDSNKLSPNNLSHHVSDDGSSTIYSDLYQAHYHSTHGAVQESMHIFINHGLRDHLSPSLNILEYGLGTGLNLFLTALNYKELNKYISYTSLELHPIDQELIKSLNYHEGIEQKELLHSIHKSPWDDWVKLYPDFQYLKVLTKFENYSAEEEFDIIYYDAFAPSSQEHLWTEEMMQKCYDALNKEGFLITYCAKGSFKRALRTVGFEVIPLDGPPGKREMTKAVKR